MFCNFLYEISQSAELRDTLFFLYKHKGKHIEAENCLKNKHISSMYLSWEKFRKYSIAWKHILASGTNIYCSHGAIKNIFVYWTFSE